MAGPINNQPVSGNESVQAKEQGLTRNQIASAEAASNAWFLPGNSNSLLPITTTGVTDIADINPQSLAERVLSHISA